MSPIPTIPFNFKPRNYQGPVMRALARGTKRAVLVWHRRSGKDKTLLNYMAASMFDRVGNYGYYFPTSVQGRKILWDGLDRDGFAYMHHFPDEMVENKRKDSMMVWLKNKSTFQIIGTDNIDSVMGTNPIGAVFSEYSLQNPVAWDYIRPILRENGGWAAFIYTPRGMNHGWDLYDKNRDNPEWYCEVLTVNDTKRPDGTPVITEEMIEADRREGMSDELIQQEYFCSFEAAMPGAYYATEMRQARDEGRVCGVQFDPAVHVDTYWDLGMDGSTSIWFGQTCGNQIHLIDYYESNLAGLGAYFRILTEKATENQWVYGRHVAPHDIRVKELTGTMDPDTPPKSRWEIAHEMGVTFEVAKRPEHKQDGIEAVRAIFPRLWIDKDRCRHGINCLTSFRRDYNPDKKVYGLVPVSDWSMHGADALQTLALIYGYAGKFGDMSEVFK